MNELRSEGPRISDAELVLRVQQGIDPDGSFKELFDRYHPRVRAFLLSKGVQGEDCKELTQETFLRVYRYIGSYYGGSVKNWLFSISRNLWRNEVRRRNAGKRKGREISLSNGERGSDGSRTELRAPEPTPEARLLSAEETKTVLAFVEDLPPRMQECLKLQARGFRVQEIACLLRRSPETVKVHLHRARKRLEAFKRERLDPTSPESGKEVR